MSSHGTTMVTASVCDPFEVGYHDQAAPSIFTNPAPSSSERRSAAAQLLAIMAAAGKDKWVSSIRWN